MRRFLLLLPPLMAAAALHAEEPMSPATFETMSEGRTLYFTLDGEAFGAEQYFKGRRSLWRYGDGTCAAGSWEARGDLICFTYEGGDGPQCWHFLEEGSGFRAALVEDDAETGFSLDYSHSDTTPLDCPGPAIGS